MWPERPQSAVQSATPDCQPDSGAQFGARTERNSANALRPPLLLNECSLLTFQKPKNKEQSTHFPWQVSERDIQKSNHLPTLDQKH